VGLNHRPPAGQVEEVDDIALALDEQVRLAGTQYLAVLRPLVVRAALRAWHGHSGQSIRALRLARLLGRPDRAGTEAPDGVTEAVHRSDLACHGGADDDSIRLRSGKPGAE